MISIYRPSAKCAFIAVVALIFLATVGVVLPAYLAFSDYRERIYDRPEDVPPAPVAIVFGAAINRNGQPSPMLADRVDAAVALLKAGKVRRILMTGDNSQIDYDEVSAMKRRAVADGAPAQLVNLDYAGFRTYDSVYRARAIFGVTEAVLVTQRYHLHRALYLANSLGIKAVGLKAGLDRYSGQNYYNLREVLALSLAWYDVNLLHPLPRFLGDPVDLERQNGPPLPQPHS